MKTINYDEVMDTFLWGFAFLTRPTLRNVLYGYPGIDHPWKADAAMERMRRSGRVQKTGRGVSASFTITATSMKQMSNSLPRQCWDAPWDGHWRVVVFDLPSHRTKDRQALWEMLRARKLGLLQRSVWIWPHEIEATLQEMTDARGLPECFCDYINYTRNLQFTEKPDYDYLRNLFVSSAKKHNIDIKYFWENTVNKSNDDESNNSIEKNKNDILRTLPSEIEKKEIVR